MFNDILKLISYTETVDDYGMAQRQEVEKLLFCRVNSIGQSEFYQAAASGLKPEIKFTIADYYDYSNEKELEYNGKRYNVLRTYRKGNELEITAYGVDE